MSNGTEPGVLIFDDDRLRGQKQVVEEGPRALFDDQPLAPTPVASPADPTFIPQAIDFKDMPQPAAPVAPSQPGAVFEDEDAQWRHLIRASVEAHPTLNPEDRGRAERMALQLFPIVESETLTFAQAALDSSNEISRDLNELVIKSTRLGIGAYLREVTEKLGPDKSKGLLSRIGITHGPDSADINAIETRLRELIVQSQDFRSEVVTLRARTAEVARRLALHGAAILAAIPQMAGSPALKLAEQRSQLIAVAATTASMTESQQKQLEENADQWLALINAALYTGIPNWRSLHAAEEQKKHN